MSVQIGNYWTMCCLEDLDEVRTQGDIDEVHELLEDEDTVSMVTVWDTREDALRDLIPKMTGTSSPSLGVQERLGLTAYEIGQYLK